MKAFKTSREMRAGAALIKDRFVMGRKSHKKHLDWGRTTPASIARWLRIEAHRLGEFDRLHPASVPHLRPDLLRWQEKVGAEGIQRLLKEWPQLRGLSDQERAARGAQRQNERLAKKHPLFAAVGALEEVARVETPASTLEQWQNHWEANRERHIQHAEKDDLYSAEARKARLYAVEEGELDEFTIKQLLVWGRLSAGPDNRLFTSTGRPTIDRPHLILAREVLLTWSRDEEHLRRMIGGIFYCIAVKNRDSDVKTHALGALRLISLELLGDECWIEEWTRRGQRRHLELQAEAEGKQQERIAQFKPRAEQLLIPLEVF